MHTFLWSRRLLGKYFDYTICLEENADGASLQVGISCKQPQLLYAMFIHTPGLIKKQLLNLAMDGAEKLNKHYQLKQVTTFLYSPNDIHLKAIACLSDKAAHDFPGGQTRGKHCSI